MTLGEVALFRKGGPHRELRAEDCQPAIRPAAGRVSPSSLKGNLDSASQCLQHFLTHFSHAQQIITQDFARNQVPSQPPQQPPTSTFQNSPSALVSTPVRTKTSNRYSPESQSQSLHHQRPGSRVSPENLVDKSRGRYGLYFKPYVNFPTVKQFVSPS